MPWTAEKIKEFRKFRVENGLCEKCGNVRGNDGTTRRCRICADNLAKIAENRRRAKGILPMKILDIPWQKGINCKDCRQNLPDGRNTHRCQDCADRVNQAAVEIKKSRHNDNVCQTCGKAKPITHGQYHMCYSCYLRSAASRHLGSSSRWKELRGQWEKQKGICPYTGKHLILGVDASVDHIFPQKRYPELKQDAKNIEWVEFRINLMKRDLTKDEFVALIKQMVNHIG